MSDARPDARTTQRADELLPEERAAGTDDAEVQAHAVLADSDERSDRSDDHDGPGAEHRPSGTDVAP